MKLKKYNEKLLKFYMENKALTNLHKKAVKEYDQYYILKGVQVQTRVSTMKVLYYLARDIKKPYKKMNKKDITNFFANYSLKKWIGGKLGADTKFVDTGKKPSKETMRTYESTAEYFFRWLGKEDLADYIKSIKPKKNIDGRAKPGDVWTQEEIKKLIESARTLRNKTALAVLYGMAGRIGECAGLNIGDVKFNEDGTAELIIRNSKTDEGKINTRFLYEATPLLKEYIESHPYKNNPDAPLFITFHDQTYRGNKPIERLGYGGWNTILKYAHTRCGVKKKLYLHLLRVSRASNMIKEGYSLPIVQKMGSWRNVNSMRPYLKLADDDVKNALLRKNGVDIKKENYDILKPKKCLKCGKVYSCDKKYCKDCNLPLDPKELFEQKKKQELKDRFVDMLMNKMDIKKLIMEKSSENVEIVDLLREYNGLSK